MDGLDLEYFSRVRLKLDDGSVVEGVLLPKPEVGNPEVIVIKLDNGYNVGIRRDRVVHAESIGGTHVRSTTVPVGEFLRSSADLPRVRLIATGGTILSKVDYSTGAVYPSFSLEDLYSMYPEIRDLAGLELLNLMAIFSEDMTPRRWSEIARAAYNAFRDGAVGVIILHGTDTMHYTAAAMAFALKKPPGPIVLVGSQRSSDRPSSDAFENLLASIVVAVKAPFGESVVAMHGSTSDGSVAVHRGVRVRKMHTSRRDAFISVNQQPIAIVNTWDLSISVTSNYLPRGSLDELELIDSFDDKVALIKFYPGMDPEILHFLVDKGYHGIVIEGSGFGHVRAELLDPIKRAVESGIPVVMASQTIFGRVNLNVYRRGVELLRLGVIPCGDMLPEVAFVKLSWLLAQSRDMKYIREMMIRPLVLEISERSELRSYLH